MINPFEKIVAPDPGQPEEIGGSYQCEICWETTDQAMYFVKDGLVIWVCPNGHKNSLEGVELD